MNRRHRVHRVGRALALLALLGTDRAPRPRPGAGGHPEGRRRRLREVPGHSRKARTPTTFRRSPRSIPNLFGIAVVTADGKVYTAGDIKTEVSIQSISKVFTMAQVIQEQGLESIEKRIGVDATGARFNSIIAVEGVKTVVGDRRAGDESAGQPRRHLGDEHGDGRDAPTRSGRRSSASTTTSAGRPLTVLQDVYKSESDTNQRNQAIGALMLAYGYIKTNWQQAVDLYTRQCSIGVNAKDLATMAATLAFGGKNPVTGKQVMDAAKVPGVLAVMATAGLYDDSGKWLYHTGLPAKSGVGGGIIAVSPGKFGIAVDFAAARRRGQQRPRAAGDRRHLERARRQSVRGREVGAVRK